MTSSTALLPGADVIGDEALISAIVEGGAKAVTFDKLIATPEFMKPLAKAGKVRANGVPLRWNAWGGGFHKHVHNCYSHVHQIYPLTTHMDHVVEPHKNPIK